VITAASAAEVPAFIIKQSRLVTAASAAEVLAYIVKQSGPITAASAAEVLALHRKVVEAGYCCVGRRSPDPPLQSSWGWLLLCRPWKSWPPSQISWGRLLLRRPWKSRPPSQSIRASYCCIGRGSPGLQRKAVGASFDTFGIISGTLN
jgi:hypothetical protein